METIYDVYDQVGGKTEVVPAAAAPVAAAPSAGATGLAKLQAAKSKLAAVSAMTPTGTRKSCKTGKNHDDFKRKDESM